MFNKICPPCPTSHSGSKLDRPSALRPRLLWTGSLQAPDYQLLCWGLFRYPPRPGLFHMAAIAKHKEASAMLSPPPEEKKKGKKKEAWIPTHTKLRIEMSSVLSIMDPHRPAVCVKQCPRPDQWIPQETGRPWLLPCPSIRKNGCFSNRCAVF